MHSIKIFDSTYKCINYVVSEGIRMLSVNHYQNFVNTKKIKPKIEKTFLNL